MKPLKLYHGSNYKIEGNLEPILVKTSEDHIHDKAAVFATERIDLASLFMFPLDYISSFGFENDIVHICIWGTREEFNLKDRGGYVYVLPGNTFEKMGKDYEWQSYEQVLPLEVKFFPSVIDGMLSCGVNVYFINDEYVFDSIVENKHNRSQILSNLISENQRQNKI